MRVIDSVQTVQSVSIPPMNLSFPIKLDRSGYLIWKEQLLCVITAFRVEEYIVGSIAASVKYHPGTIEVTSEYSIWNRGNGTIRSWIYSSVSSEVSSYLTDTKTVHDPW